MADFTNYSVKLEGNGLSLEREVSKEVGDQIVMLILTGDCKKAPPVTLQNPLQQPPDPQPQANIVNPQQSDQDPSCTTETSIREYLDSCEAQRNPDKITAIGCYYRDHKKKDSFTRDDIIKGFEDAAEVVPKNPSRDIKWAVTSGWIALRSGTKDQYYVTNTGSQAVNGKFPKQMLKRTRTKKATQNKNNNSQDSE